MAQRENVRDTEESCRNKARTKFEKLRRELKSHDPARDDFDILVEIHANAKHTAERCRENIEDGHYTRHIDKPDLVIAFENAARTAVHIMNMACTQMMTMKNKDGQYLTAVNCTSVQFRACSLDLCSERSHIPDIAKIVDTKIMPLLAEAGETAPKTEFALH